jgi:peptidoglycan/LPS O-acetylase OafA/YrhL
MELRGIGFLLVITAHIPSVPFFGYLHGWTGVWLFLAISGYLVTMLMMREEKSQGCVAFGPFLIKRFFRIVPSYWTAILIYLVVCRALPPLADDYEQIAGQLPYLFGFCRSTQTLTDTVF